MFRSMAGLAEENAMWQWVTPLLIGGSVSLALWAADIAENAKAALSEVKVTAASLDARLKSLESTVGSPPNNGHGTMDVRIRRLESSVDHIDIARIETSVARVKATLNEIDVRLGLLDAHAKASLLSVQLALANDVTDLKSAVAELQPRLDDVINRTQSISGGIQAGKNWTTISFGDAEARFRADGVFAIYDENNRRVRLNSTGH